MSAIGQSAIGLTAWYARPFRIAVQATLRGHDQRGITLVEVLVALALIGVGLLAVGTAFPAATSGVEAARQQTTATFLAEQRLEQIRATPYANITSANFPAEDYGAIRDAGGNPLPSAARYRRVVTITNNPAGTANTSLVRATVFYRPIMAWGVLTSERQVSVTTLVADR
jgi:type IV pilus assembly protein PilV